MILVDGVWVDIQYTIDDKFKEDQSGHIRAMSASRRTSCIRGDGSVGRWLPRTDSLRSC
jgi:hypothetical protein